MSGYPTGIGDYQIRGVLGSGASGTVFLAYQQMVDRRVALKELSAELTADPAFRERFRAEAEVMARLDNDNCVRVFDYFQREEHDYLVTELVDGASLRKIVQHAGQLTPEEALGVVKGALLGLASAHEIGLLHRDIKPENVLVNTEGVSKLADFGQASVQSGPGAAGGMPAGSPAYMSPEMVGGGPLDARSDLYSAGAVLFELLTGRPPFVADNPLAVMRMQREAPVPDAHAANPNLGPGVTGLLTASLAKDPADRPANAAAMLASLEAVAAEAYGADWESRSSLKRKVAATVGAGMGLLAMLGAAGGLAAAGAVGSAVTAAAIDVSAAGGAGGVLGVSWAVAAVIAGVLVASGAAAYAETHGYLAGSKAAAVIAGGSPTPAASVGAVISQTPDVSPPPSAVVSPSPSPGPSPSSSPAATFAPPPTPTRAPTKAPTRAPTAPPTPAPPQPKGPVVATSLVPFFVVCNPRCKGPSDGSAWESGPPISPYNGAAPCGPSSVLSVLEQYNYNYANTAGGPVPITVSWTGTIRNPAVGNRAISGSHTSQILGGPGSNTHPADAAMAFNVGLNGASGDQGGNVTFDLTWNNPDGSPGRADLGKSFYFGCG